MIPLVGILKYENNKELDFAVTRFVNDTLITIWDMLYDIEIESQGAESLFHLIPSGCYRDNTFSYIRKLQEIRVILADDLLRKGVISLSPLNQYVIYKMIVTYIEICDSSSEDTSIEIPDDLKMAINACDDYWIEGEAPNLHKRYNVVLQSISNYKNYLEFLFEDWDFLETCATAFAADYLDNPNSRFNEYGIEELDEFSPMISDDIYAKLKKVTDKNMEKDNTNMNISVNGDHAIINTGSARDIKSESVQPDISSNTQRKSFYEKYSIGTIIAALISQVGSILTKIFKL